MSQSTLQGRLTQVSPLPGGGLHPITQLRLPASVQGHAEGPPHLQSRRGTSASQLSLSI